jgi:thiamine-phosphate pyrophosphorylase
VIKKIGRLCVITDTVIQKKYSHLEIAKLAVKGGADMIQFRDKNMPTGEMAETAIKICKLCNRNKIKFIVNDRVDVALLSDADGVHLGKDDLSVNDARKLLGTKKIIGATAHSLAEAVKAEKEGADYIGYGHIYTTSTKLKTSKPKGLKNLTKVCKKINIPVFAIGGIGIENAKDVISTNAHGIAVVGSVVKSKNPKNTVKKLREIIYA